MLPTGPRRASQTPCPPQPLPTGPFPGQSPSLRVLTDVTSHLLFSMCICLSVSPTRVEAPCWLDLVHTRHPQCPEWGEAHGQAQPQLALGFAALIVHVSALPGDSWRSGSYFLMSLVLSNQYMVPNVCQRVQISRVEGLGQEESLPSERRGPGKGSFREPDRMGL